MSMQSSGDSVLRESNHKGSFQRDEIVGNDSIRVRSGGFSSDSYFSSLQDNLRSRKQLYRKVTLIASDVLAIAIAFVFSFMTAEFVRLTFTSGSLPGQMPSLLLIAQVFGITSIFFLASSYYRGHYRRFLPIWTEIHQILNIGLYLWIGMAGAMFLAQTPFPRLWFTSFIVILVVAAPIIRCNAKLIMMRTGLWLKPTYVIGVGENAALTGMALDSDRWMGHQVQGYIKLSDDADISPLIPAEKIFNSDALNISALKNNERPCIVFAFDSMADLRANSLVFNRFIASRDNITVSPPIRGLPLYGAEVLNVFKHDTVLLRLTNNLSKRSSRLLKRVFDLSITLLSVILLAPVFAALWLWIKSDGGPAIFKHERIGLDGKKFQCLKFRSMAVDADEQLKHLLATSATAREEWERDHKLKVDPRITAVGEFLRKTSLDELPQLFNVLKGEMSLVGPRPIVQAEVVKYGEFYPYYCMSVPGITGLWQSSGRNDTSYKERVWLDVWYAQNWSLWHDFVIMARTIPSLLMSKGAY